MERPDSTSSVDTDGLWDWNLVSNRIHFSPRWIAFTGHDDDAVGNTADEWFQRVHPDDLDGLTRELNAIRAGGPGEFEMRHRLRHRDGTYRWTVCRGSVTRDSGGQATRLRGSHSNVTVNAGADPVSGLPNRLLFMDRVTRAIEQASQYPGLHFAVVVLDLGRTPPADGAVESATTDSVLTAVARRLETCLHGSATQSGVDSRGLAARLPGDQFAILLEGLAEIGDAKSIADQILQQLLAPLTLSGNQYFLATSMGVAVSATGYTRAEEMLRDAEIAQGRARSLGGSHCEVFDTAVLKSAQAELLLEAGLDQALERGEFRLFYQPIVSLTSNRVVGLEALVRWEHPELGLVSPADFIAMAERTGFIVPLGEWVLRTACVQLKSWQETIPDASDLWISVNLSSVQWKEPTLVDQIAHALRESGLDSRGLVLELTESIAMANPTAVRGLLMQVRAMGVRISIDDFGTGYSSLSYLRQFPVDALKLDRSFVLGMETHTDKADIIGTMTAMSQQLGLHVVAEGIESAQQVDLLRALHCDSAQGHFYSKPLDASGATAILTSGLSHTDEQSDVAGETAVEPASPVARLFTWNSSKGWAAAAAALAVVASAGVFNLTSHPRASRSDLKAPPAKVERPAQAPAAVVPSGSRTAVDKTRPSVSTTAPAGTRTQSQTAPRNAAAGTAAAGRTAAVRIATIEVVHQHRVGKCEGRLLASADGMIFEPHDGKDAFVLKHSDFVQTLEADTLILRTSDRTYRFKAPDGAGPGQAIAQLHQFMQTAAAFR